MKNVLATKLPSQRKVAIVTALTVVAVSLILFLLYAVNSFFEVYRFRFQAPIVIRVPVWIERRGEILTGVTVEATPSATPKTTPSLTPTPTVIKQGSLVQPVLAAGPSDEAIIKGKTNGDILWKVYTLESSKGKNDGCKDSGKFNGFGYGQNTNVWNCFDTFEEVAHKVSVWFDTKMESMSLSEALCLYNTGTATKSCDYYRKYLSL